MKGLFWLGFLFFFFSFNAFAADLNQKLSREFHPAIKQAPAPTPCVTPTFSQTGDSYWYTISLQLTNNCGIPLNFQNSTVTFNSGDNLNTSFWGNFNPLSYPINTLQITSQQVSTGGYTASLSLQFPTESWAVTVLPAGDSITLIYGAPFDSYNANSVQVYLSGSPPVGTGTINISNATAQPSLITQPYALVNVVFNGQTVNTVQVPWSGSVAVNNLTPGSYTLEPQSLTDSQGNSYQGTASPNPVTVTSNATVNSTVSYQQITNYGSINIQTSALPAALAGYTSTPSVVLTQTNTGATVTQSVPWNATTRVANLTNGATYQFSTPQISYNGYRCAGSFNPTSAVSSAASPPSTALSYACQAVAQDQITLNVSGLPSSVNSVTVTLQPSDGSSATTQNVSISNGSGSNTVNLTDGVVYSVSSSAVSGYTPMFNPQPLTATSGGVETISYQQQTGGRLIAYVVGWETPPPATALANAGYTHLIAAFGVFSTTSPGQIVNAFSTITPEYVTQVHQAGMKISLSLGGASTSLADTSVDFDQVLSMASSPAAFQQAFVSSVESLVSQYGFDGVDFDIESGLNAGGTFNAPTGDIAVLANIINQLYKDNPNLLISLAPQTANISATSGFSATWGNYSSLIMQTYQSLAWVGVQIYNTGCMYGLNQVCYADSATSPDLSVAMAADLLENWPATTPSGQATGFQPYISYLNPSQVVLGYPAPNAQGASDGSPVKPVSVIKRAIQCLRTGVLGSNSCDTYSAPHVYPSIGGVFEWEATYDQSNNYAFATGLQACVVDGSC